MAPHHLYTSACGVDKLSKMVGNSAIAVYCKVDSLIAISYIAMDIWQNASLQPLSFLKILHFQ